MKITFLNQKGGVGKTTLVLLMAGVLKKSGYDVAIDDRDPQGSARFFTQNFDVPLLADNPNAEFVLVDTPGHMKLEGELLEQITRLIAESDKLIVVADKSPATIHGTAPMVRLVNERKRPEAKAFLLFNKVRGGTTMGQQSGPDIAVDLGVTPLENELPLSQSFENAFVAGMSAVTGKHREELFKLALEIMK